MNRRLDATAFPELTRLVTDEVAVANRYPAPGWQSRIYRLGPGPFEYAYERVDLGDGVRVAYVRYAGAARLVASLEARSLQLLFPSGEQTMLCGVALQDEAPLVATFGPCQADSSTQRGAETYNLLLQGAAYEAVVAACPALAAGRGTYAPGRHLFRPRPEGDALRAQVRALVQQANRDPAAALAPERKAAARAQLIALACRVVAGLAEGAEDIVPRHPRARALALAVERFVWQRVQTAGSAAISLEQASKATGYSVRSLQLAVEEHFGTTFVRFVRAARLHQVHAELVRESGQTVADVATRYGFWHLGRFSRYYREMFGEPPSHTAGRGRARRAVLAA
jgi:AraC-like DNA-binding protein